MRYDDYIKSDSWRAVRARYFASDLPQKCCGCESSDVQLHHRTYERLGRELLTDLAPLCQKCHTMLHEFHKSIGGSLEESTDVFLSLHHELLNGPEKRGAPAKHARKRRKKYEEVNPRGRIFR